MPGQITALAGKLALFKKGSTVYQWSKWNIRITLDTGRVLHFDSLTDGAGNYWPSTYANFADAEGEVSGFIDNAIDLYAISSGGNSHYIGNTGTFVCLWSATNGLSFPGRFKGNDLTGDAAAKDPAAAGNAFEFTGPPTRIFS